MPKWLEHTALSVSNLGKSITFYRDQLGLRLARVIESDANLRLGDIVGLPGCQARIAHLESEKGMLELFEYRKPFGRLYERRMEFYNAPVEFRPGAWVVYFRRPDGEVGELRQT